jgi:hypothetical protein
MITLLIHFLVICKLAGLTSLNACKDIAFFSNGKSGAESRKQKAEGLLLLPTWSLSIA